jgi:hypothetical protein
MSIRTRFGRRSWARRTPFFPSLGLDDLVALERQEVPDELLTLAVVLDDEDHLIRHGALEV